MNQTKIKSADTPQKPVFPQTLHRLRPNPGPANPKAKKRDNIFSKSRNAHEDRGTRQMKTAHDSQALFRICGHLNP
jgi:hypothetical protein